MTTTTRFGVSIPDNLIKQFDRFIKERNYTNRSEAIRDLIREKLVEKDWAEGRDSAGAIIIVFDHHQRELQSRLTEIQHDFYHVIISSQHVHFDHHNCMEMVVVRGKTKDIKKLADLLKSTKGVKHCSVAMTTTGKELS